MRLRVWHAHLQLQLWIAVGQGLDLGRTQIEIIMDSIVEKREVRFRRDICRGAFDDVLVTQNLDSIQLFYKLLSNRT